MYNMDLDMQPICDLKGNLLGCNLLKVADYCWGKLNCIDLNCINVEQGRYINEAPRYYTF